MKFVHNIEMRVFSKEDDDEDIIIGKIKELFPFEKLNLKRKTTYGFEDKKIIVFTINASKQRQTNIVLKKLYSFYPPIFYLLYL